MLPFENYTTQHPFGRTTSMDGWEKVRGGVTQAQAQAKRERTGWRSEVNERERIAHGIEGQGRKQQGEKTPAW